jgi:hypothetical protein
MLIVILSAFMLNAKCCYAERLYDTCRYAECHYPE